jgi:hypothetical protein
MDEGDLILWKVAVPCSKPISDLPGVPYEWPKIGNICYFGQEIHLQL